MIAMVYIIIGAAWRFIDGLSKDTSRIPTGVRNAVTFILCAVFFFKPWETGLLHLDWPVIWVPTMACLSLIIGCTKWESAMWQAIRFGGMAAITVWPIDHSLETGIYIVACAVAGMGYTLLGKIDSKLPRFWLFDGFESYARLPLGAAIIGCLAFL